ncbi:hypothetical protein [Streptomyces chattanoogensis]|uniref:Uncharacterized protein n=1 Tax=Streptomyces chattanoogensis TaxID=66876 RepID=A0A0N0GYL8_9ACTN|nr:hypothetical protein [Streptomyces chattanoogensis]KPC61700.1 hypothetical protein ADL29_22860 [Streptomyces chattanoogensis]
MRGRGCGHRAVRAGLFTALCVALSAASHVLLSGTPLPPAALAAVCTGVCAAAYALTGRERGFGAAAALLVPLRPAGRELLCRGGESGTPPARLIAHAGGLLRAVAAFAFRPLLRVPGCTADNSRPGRARRGAPRHLPPAAPFPLLAHCVRRRGPPRTAAV